MSVQKTKRGFFGNIARWFAPEKADAGSGTIAIRRLDGKCRDEEKDYIYHVDINGNGDAGHLLSRESDLLTEIGGVNFFVSPIEIPVKLDCVFEHDECPGGIHAEAVLLVKLLPCARPFGNWLLVNVQDELSVTQLAEKLTAPEYGIEAYLQKIIRGTANVSNLVKYGQGSVVWNGQDAVLPPWLEVKNIAGLKADILPSETEIKLKEFNAEQEKLADDISRRQLLLDYQLKLNDMEQSKKDIAARNERLEIERAGAIKAAEIRAANELERQRDAAEVARLEKDIKASEARIKAGEADALAADLENKKLQRDRLAAKLKTESEIAAIQKENEEKKLQKEAEVAARQLEILQIEAAIAEEKRISQSAIAGEELKQAKLNTEILACQLEKDKAEVELIRQNIRMNDSIAAEKSSAASENRQIDSGLINALLQNFAVQQNFSAVQQQKIKEAISDLMKDPAGAAAGEEAGNSLTAKTSRQSAFCNVHLEKYGVESFPGEFTCRGIKMEVETDNISVGEKMELSFTSPIDGWITLLCRDALGDTTVLIPNFIDGNLRVEANRKYTFPAPDGSLLRGMRLRQCGPAGREYIMAIVSEEKLLPVPDIDNLQVLTTGKEKALNDKIDELDSGKWAAGYLSYRVEE